MKTRIYLSLLTALSCQNLEKSNSCKEIITADSSAVKVQDLQKAEINIDNSDTLVKVSEPFVINDIKCYWEFTLIINAKANAGEGTVCLKNSKTNKVLLSNSDYYDRDLFNSLDKNNFYFNGEFKDANFDCTKDFIVSSRTASGSGGNFFNVYLYNKQQYDFEYSDEISGAELEINAKEKTVSTYWKTGVDLNSGKVHHFDN